MHIDSNNNWYKDIETRINSSKSSLSKKEYNKYQLDTLLRISQRVRGFSPECEECLRLQADISQMVDQSGNSTGLSKDQYKAYCRSMNNIIHHLREKHKLALEGESLGIWIGIGAALGIVFGIIMDNIAIGIAIGAALGVTIGSSLNYKNKKDDRVI